MSSIASGWCGLQSQKPPFPLHSTSLVHVPSSECTLEMVVVKVGSAFGCNSNTQWKLPWTIGCFSFHSKESGDGHYWCWRNACKLESQWSCWLSLKPSRWLQELPASHTHTVALSHKSSLGQQSFPPVLKERNSFPRNPQQMYMSCWLELAYLANSRWNKGWDSEQ